MQVTREDLNPCTVQLTVTLTPDEVKDAFERSFKAAAKTVRVAGFRPGHAPRAMLERMIDPTSLYDSAADLLVRGTLAKAIEEASLEPDRTTRPAVDVRVLSHETHAAEYVAKVPLPAQVELGDYKGIPLQKLSDDVDEEEVEYQIEEYRQRRSTRTPITDRGVGEGDVAVLNIKRDGDAGDGRNFMVVVGQTFPMLDQAVAGMKVEDMRHVDLTFPVNFQEADWAGTSAKCTVTLNSASTLQMPALDEAFAQSLKTEGVEDLKARVRANLVHAKARMNRDIMIESAMDQLLQRSKVEVSDNSWEDIANRRLGETQEEQREAGKTMEEYAQENGMSLPELIDAWREKARLYIKRAFLIREVFVKEDMSLTNEDLNLELAQMSVEYDVEPKEMAEMLQKNNALEELRFRAISRKVSDFLLEHAAIVGGDEPKPARAAKAAKEPKAGKA